MDPLNLTLGDALFQNIGVFGGRTSTPIITSAIPSTSASSALDFFEWTPETLLGRTLAVAGRCDMSSGSPTKSTRRSQDAVRSMMIYWLRDHFQLRVPSILAVGERLVDAGDLRLLFVTLASVKERRRVLAVDAERRPNDQDFIIYRAEELLPDNRLPIVGGLSLKRHAADGFTSTMRAANGERATTSSPSTVEAAKRWRPGRPPLLPRLNNATAMETITLAMAAMDDAPPANQIPSGRAFCPTSSSFSVVLCSRSPFHVPPAAPTPSQTATAIEGPTTGLASLYQRSAFGVSRFQQSVALSTGSPLPRFNFLTASNNCGRTFSSAFIAKTSAVATDKSDSADGLFGNKSTFSAAVAPQPAISTSSSISTAPVFGGRAFSFDATKKIAEMTTKKPSLGPTEKTLSMTETATSTIFVIATTADALATTTTTITSKAASVPIESIAVPVAKSAGLDYALCKPAFNFIQPPPRPDYVDPNALSAPNLFRFVTTTTAITAPTTMVSSSLIIDHNTNQPLFASTEDCHVPVPILQITNAFGTNSGSTITVPPLIPTSVTTAAAIPSLSATSTTAPSMFGGGCSSSTCQPSAFGASSSTDGRIFVGNTSLTSIGAFLRAVPSRLLEPTVPIETAPMELQLTKKQRKRINQALAAGQVGQVTSMSQLSSDLLINSAQRSGKRVKSRFIRNLTSRAVADLWDVAAIVEYLVNCVCHAEARQIGNPKPAPLLLSGI